MKSLLVIQTAKRGESETKYFEADYFRNDTQQDSTMRMVKICL